MRMIRLSNDLFRMGLDAQEITVFAYLCSLLSIGSTLTGSMVVSVRQRTIAEHSGIKSPVTVAKVIGHLCERGLVEILDRSIKANGHKGTYLYAVRKPKTQTDYFMVDQSVFGQLVPRQMMVYLFLCKSFCTVRNDCWNSYNDISAQIGMKRETVIRTVRELIDFGLIVRMRRHSRRNRRVFVDNHYVIVRFGVGTIRAKMPDLQLKRRSVFFPGMYGCCKVVCTLPPKMRYAIRGSPQNASQYSVPKCNLTD